MRVVPKRNQTASLLTAALLLGIVFAVGATGDPGDDPGGIDGRVLDIHLDIVEDAILWLVQDGELIGEERSDEHGWYEFQGVPAGDHELQVHHWQHESKTRSVVVAAGETTRVNIALEPLETDDPPEDPSEGWWHGFMGCSVNYPTAYQAWACPDDNNDMERIFTVEPGLKTLVVAMEWETSPLCTSENLRHWLYAPADSSLAKVRAEAPSPIEYRLDVGEDFAEIEDPTQWRFHVTGPSQGVQFCYQQPFIVHYHMFYQDHAPEGYSALP